MSSGAATRNLLRRAHAAHQQGRLSEAESGYRSVLRIRPEDPDALHFLGMLHFQRGERAEAIQLVRRSLVALGTNPHAWNNLGNMLLACDQPPEAAEAYEKATQYGSQMAETWYNRAVCLRRVRQYDLAIDCFLKTIELQPQFAPVYERLGMMLYSLGRFRDAADVYRKWLLQDETNPIARHMLSALSGEDVPARADDEYLRMLFDRFAGSFDENLSDLGYRAPELLAATLGEYVASDGRLEILDAGCGTGLCGPLLRSMARRLVGVDLSPGMIEKAQPRNVYDELVVGELCAFMRTRPGTFDAIVSADTLVYFGALEEAAAAARQCLRPGGVLAFTVERLAQEGGSEEPYRIQPHGRYAHREDYVRQALLNAGFARVDIKPVVLRRERGEDVHGHLVAALLDLNLISSVHSCT
jgi:predicted TPR repeat methyltransferase